MNRSAPTLDWCRHCLGENLPMTLEHLPPKSADNTDPVRRLDDAGAILAEFAEGHAIPVLCNPCNKGASDRGLPVEYKLWRLEVVEAIKEHTAREAVGLSEYNIWRTDSVVEVDHGYNLHPGRIARQLLGMLLAIQDDPSFSRDNPKLRDAYFDDGEDWSISPMALYVALANTNYRYFSSELMGVTLDLSTGDAVVKPMRVWSFSPFIAVLTEDGSDPPFPAMRVDEWLTHPVSYHFRKKDRHAGYPIAPRFNPLVSMMYGQSPY